MVHSPCGDNVDQSIHERVVATPTELGMPAPSDFHQTMLMKDRRFVGHKFCYDGGYAILRVDSNTLELYDEQGKLLKTVAIEDESGAAA